MQDAGWCNAKTQTLSVEVNSTIPNLASFLPFAELHKYTHFLHNATPYVEYLSLV